MSTLQDIPMELMTHYLAHTLDILNGTGRYARLQAVWLVDFRGLCQLTRRAVDMFLYHWEPRPFCNLERFCKSFFFATDFAGTALSRLAPHLIEHTVLSTYGRDHFLPTHAIVRLLPYEPFQLEVELEHHILGSRETCRKVTRKFLGTAEDDVSFEAYPRGANGLADDPMAFPFTMAFINADDEPKFSFEGGVVRSPEGVLPVEVTFADPSYTPSPDRYPTWFGDEYNSYVNFRGAVGEQGKKDKLFLYLDSERRAILTLVCLSPALKPERAQLLRFRGASTPHSTPHSTRS